MLGSLESTSVAELCLQLAAQRATTTLTIESPEGRGAIGFRKGHIVWANSPSPRARLGDRLVNAGLLDRPDLDAALSRQASLQRRTKLGALLVEADVVSRDAVRVFVQEQLIDALLELLGWHSGSFELVEGDAPVERLPIDVPTTSVLMEARRRLTERTRIRAQLPNLAMIPDHVADVAAPPTLEPDEFAMLASIDGDRSIEQLADDLGYGRDEAARILYGLLLHGVVSVGGGGQPDLRVVTEGDFDIGAALDEALGLRRDEGGAPVEESGRPRITLHVDDEVSLYLRDRPDTAAAPEPAAPEPPAARSDGPRPRLHEAAAERLGVTDPRAGSLASALSDLLGTHRETAPPEPVPTDVDEPAPAPSDAAPSVDVVEPAVTADVEEPAVTADVEEPAVTADGSTGDEEVDDYLTALLEARADTAAASIEARTSPEPEPVDEPEPEPAAQPEPEPTPVLQPEPTPVLQPEPTPVLQPEPTPAAPAAALDTGSGADEGPEPWVGFAHGGAPVEARPEQPAPAAPAAATPAAPPAPAADADDAAALFDSLEALTGGAEPTAPPAPAAPAAPEGDQDRGDLSALLRELSSLSAEDDVSSESAPPSPPSPPRPRKPEPEPPKKRRLFGR